ncbi:MAG: hypothetical protein U7M05_03720, partial [Candidatus Igneacidithiobacillus chanchocoensis]
AACPTASIFPDVIEAVSQANAPGLFRYQELFLVHRLRVVAALPSTLRAWLLISLMERFVAVLCIYLHYCCVERRWGNAPSIRMEDSVDGKIFGSCSLAEDSRSHRNGSGGVPKCCLAAI